MLAYIAEEMWRKKGALLVTVSTHFIDCSFSALNRRALPRKQKDLGVEEVSIYVILFDI